MKECPICHASCFDDMDVCYGCLHDFTMDDICEEEVQMSDVVLPFVQEDSGEIEFEMQPKRRIIIEFEGFENDLPIKITQEP